MDPTKRQPGVFLTGEEVFQIVATAFRAGFVDGRPKGWDVHEGQVRQALRSQLPHLPSMQHMRAGGSFWWEKSLWGDTIPGEPVLTPEWAKFSAPDPNGVNDAGQPWHNPAEDPACAAYYWSRSE